MSLRRAVCTLLLPLALFVAPGARGATGRAPTLAAGAAPASGQPREPSPSAAGAAPASGRPGASVSAAGAALSSAQPGDTFLSAAGAGPSSIQPGDTFLSVAGAALSGGQAGEASPSPLPSAETPPPDPAALPEGNPPGTPDLDELAASLGAPPSAAEEISATAQKLNFFGFADFTYWKPLDDQSNAWLRYFPRDSTFWVGNFNLYLSANLTERIRSMGEVRFLYLPHGGWNPLTYDSTGLVKRPNDDINDPAEFGGVVRWGGIQIQRIWVEYELHYLLVVRVGQFLTPYGIWNVDHGTPIIIGIQRPWIIREQLFPERQTGIEVYGQRAASRYTLGYHLTLSNGRGPSDAFLDTNGNKALGGRLYLDYRAEALLTLGASFYYGRYTKVEEQFEPIPPGKEFAGFHVNTVDQYDEMALGADLRLQWRRLLVQSEFLLNDRAYTDPGRAANAFAPGHWAPDIRRYGGYVIGAYRLPFWRLMPYFRVDYLHLDNYYRAFSYGIAIGKMPDALSFYAGLNIRVAPPLVVKAELVHTLFPGAPFESWGHDNVNGLMFQVAWAF